MKEQTDLYALDLASLGITTVALDYGGVIADMIEEDTLSILAEFAGVPKSRFISPYWSLRTSYDEGVWNFETYMRNVFAACDSPFTEQADYHTLFLTDTRAYSRVREKMIEWIRRMKKEGITFIIISNIAVEAAQLLIEESDWASLFDHRIYSGEVGINKPDQRIFRHALSLLNSDGSSALFIDDRKENVEAAETAGFMGAWSIRDGVICSGQVNGCH